MPNRSKLNVRRLCTPFCLVLACGLPIAAATLLLASQVTATPPTDAATAPATSSPPAAATPAADASEEVPDADPDPTHATIVFATQPPATAIVTWGRKKLGRITPSKPLVVIRPRDSGPLDVMVRASGYLAVQTRAHTFSNNRVVVKLTTPENESELLGYRAPLDAGVETPEQAAALDAIGGTDSTTPQNDGMFRVVPAAPVPQAPWLLP